MTTTRNIAVLGALVVTALGSFGTIAYAEGGTMANAPSFPISDRSQTSVSVDDSARFATKNSRAANQKCGVPGKDGQDGADGATSKGGKGGKGGAAGNCTN